MRSWEVLEKNEKTGWKKNIKELHTKRVALFNDHCKSGLFKMKLHPLDFLRKELATFHLAMFCSISFLDAALCELSNVIPEERQGIVNSKSNRNGGWIEGNRTITKSANWKQTGPQCFYAVFIKSKWRATLEVVDPVPSEHGYLEILKKMLKMLASPIESSLTQHKAVLNTVWTHGSLDVLYTLRTFCTTPTESGMNYWGIPKCHGHFYVLQKYLDVTFPCWLNSTEKWERPRREKKRNTGNIYLQFYVIPFSGPIKKSKYIWKDCGELM